MENFHDLDLKKVGTRIRNARKKHGLTQAKAAEQAVISSQFWSLVETGKERASVNTYLLIADMFGLTLDDFFYDDANTMRLHKAFSIEAILVGCTDSEKAIIGETVLALRDAFERNRHI